ncbi:hypothetical protein [Nocardiopsis sp. TNDT3]|uniref:hypothetical protein n=1 Tax=Nocardiopsis sp. TNDT3 TaxID=2249354 RepID=UPI000E3EBFE1|nr:hypothetical protein [Nocardiopsis sp. TNDT3]
MTTPTIDECTSLDHGPWHFCPDNSGDAHRGCVDLDVRPDEIHVRTGRPATAPGTILNLTATDPGWTITFTQAGHSWSSPVVAWAALATEYGTGMIDPVLVADTGQTVTLRAYLEGQGPLLDVLDYTVTWAPPAATAPTLPGDLSALATVTVSGCWTLTDPTGFLAEAAANGHWPTREEAEAHRDKLAYEGFEVDASVPVRSTAACRVAACASCGAHFTNWEGTGLHAPTATGAITAAATAGRTDPMEWHPGDAWKVRPDGRLDCPACTTNEGNDQ